MVGVPFLLDYVSDNPNEILQGHTGQLERWINRVKWHLWPGNTRNWWRDNVGNWWDPTSRNWWDTTSGKWWDGYWWDTASRNW